MTLSLEVILPSIAMVLSSRCIPPIMPWPTRDDLISVSDHQQWLDNSTSHLQMWHLSLASPKTRAAGDVKCPCISPL